MSNEAVSDAAPTAAVSAFAPAELIAFWREAGPKLWFAVDAAFDGRFHERFLLTHEAAARGELESWLETAESALALVLLLDQFPRHAFRGSPRMYGTDHAAKGIAEAAIAAGHDRALSRDLQQFFYLPFSHSEHMADQQRAVDLCRHLGGEVLAHAEQQRDIVWRFGHFPQRNHLLGRRSTAAEEDYVAEAGSAG